MGFVFVGFLLLTCASIASAAKSAAGTKFRQNNGLAYIRNVLEPDQLAIVQRRVQALKKGGKALKLEKGSYAQGRKGCQLSTNDPICEIFSSTMVTDRIKRATDRESSLILPIDLFPLELRDYMPGAYMAWHKDDVLFHEPQLELVFTVENESDSETMWLDSRGATHSVSTEVNSMIIIEADSVEHCVTPLKRGRRTILKGLVVESGQSEILDVAFFEKAKATFTTRTKEGR